MEKTSLADQREAREYYQTYHHNQHGERLLNGKYEWIHVGGGRRRYWSEEYGDYVDMTPAELRASSSGSRGHSRR